MILPTPAKRATGLATGFAMPGAARRNRACTTASALAAAATSLKPWPKPTRPLLGRPGCVVTGPVGLHSLVGQDPTARIGRGRPVARGLMRLFSCAGGRCGIGGHDIVAVMHPAMPAGRDVRGIGIAAAIGHVAPVCLAILIVFVGEFVAADIVAETPDPQPRAPGLAAPPGEDFSEELLDTGFGHL